MAELEQLRREQGARRDTIGYRWQPSDWRRLRKELHQLSPAQRSRSTASTAVLAQAAFVLSAAAFFAIVAALADAGQFEIWLAASTSVLVSSALLMLGQSKPLPQRLMVASSWTFVIGATLGGLRIAQTAGLTG